jgi:hypothetical protein
MRRVLIGDLVAAVQVLAAADRSQRAALAQGLIAEADAAHRYMKRYGRAHPQWGIGTLEARARGQRAALQVGFDLGDGRILDALAVLAAALQARRHLAAKPSLAAHAPHVLN